jgi:hypothetical protein
MNSQFNGGARGVERFAMINRVRFPTSSDAALLNRVKNTQNSG